MNQRGITGTMRSFLPAPGRRARRTLAAALLAATLLLSSGRAGAQLGHSGRWLTYNGSPVYMVGIDFQSAVGADAWDDGSGGGYDGDYLRLLDAVQAAGLNKVRIWANVFFRPADEVEQPFLRTNSGKYDLTQWNPTYWARLRDFVEQARQRGIFVEYCLFAQYPHADMADGTRSANYWASANNINGAFHDTDGTDGLLYEFFKDEGGAISGHPFSYYQDQLIAKAVSEIGGYGNVFFLVMNEPDTRDRSAFPWMRDRAAAIKAHADVIVATEVRPDPWQGPGSIQEDLDEFWDDPNVDIIGGHAYDTNPSSVSDKLHGAQLKGKILHDNEGHDLRNETDQAVREAWGWAMAGGYYSFYTRDRDFIRVGDATWNRVIQAAATLKNVFESLPFSTMSPVDPQGNEYDSLASQAPGSTGWQVMAAPGSAYLVYTWGTPTSDDLVIDLEAGQTYDYRWVDVRDGTTVGSGQVDGGDAVTIPAPDTSAWAGNYGLAAVITNTNPQTNPDAGLDGGPMDASRDAGAPQGDSGQESDASMQADAASNGDGATQGSSEKTGCNCRATGSESVPALPLFLVLTALAGLLARQRGIS